MLIYSGLKSQFDKDVLSGMIGEKIEYAFYSRGMIHHNDSEFASWQNSLREMQHVLSTDDFPSDLQVAVEYQIPQTSKRVDFLIGGTDSTDQEHIVVIELKQWTEATKTNTDGIVTAYTGGSLKAVAHPSYQAYSYAKTIENFNATVQDESIGLHPCAFLHNYRDDKLNEVKAPIYHEIIDLAPLYIKSEVEKLRAFIRKYIKKGPNGDLLYKIDHGRLRPSKALQDTIVSMINGNEEFVMIDEQKIVYEAVRNLVKKSREDGQKRTVIVEGGPGTGKSVVAIQLLADLIAHDGLVVSYVTKNAAPRNVYFEKLKRGKARLNYIKTLFKGSGNFYDCSCNFHDCLIVDESHRLNAKSGLYQNQGENQIKEIIQASKVSVFFIDEDQVVTTKDIGSVAEISYWAERLGSGLYKGEQYKLSSQFRCNGSDGYIAFIDDVLGIKETANADGFDMDYDIRVFDNPCEMREALREKNEINNKARMIAGYCYEWVSKNKPELSDIILPYGFEATWNYSNTKTWAIDPGSFDQIGCIHTSQGLEFDYVGVIIGQDLRYEGGRIITDASKRAKTDQSLRGIKNCAIDADRIIRNTYKTLLTRGQKGCYIYCEDEALKEYLRKRLKRVLINSMF